PGYQGRYFSMPARNVIPKPLQKPHPPVWVAASRNETSLVAASLGMGSLGFSFDSPEETARKVTEYWEIFNEDCVPIGKASNPAVAAVGNLMCRRTLDEALDLGLPGAAFFGYALGASFPGTNSTITQNPGQGHINREFVASRASQSATAALPADEGAANLA